MLLLAILEHAPATGGRFTRGWSGGRVSFWLALARTGLVSVAALLAGILLLGPAHLVLAGRAAAAETE